MTRSLALAICFMFAAALSVAAHDGIHEQIIAVTAEIRKSPKNPDLYLKRAELYRLHREFRNAEKDLNRAARLRPNLAIIDLRKGKLAFDERRYAKARTALERFMRAEPNAFEGALALARTYAKLGQMNDAVSRFEQSITLAAADSVEIFLELADVLRRAGRDTDALQWLNRGIAERGSLLTLELAAFEAEVRLKRFDAAIARIERVSAPMARKESFLLMKGETEIRAGQLCAARVSLNDARKGYESRTSFQRNLRAVRSELARLDAALKKSGSCRE